MEMCKTHTHLIVRLQLVAVEVVVVFVLAVLALALGQIAQVLIRDVVQRFLDVDVLASVREMIRRVAAVRQAVHVSAFADQELHQVEVLQVHS